MNKIKFFALTVLTVMMVEFVFCAEKGKEKKSGSKDMGVKSEMVEIPGKNIKMLNTEVTQKMYEAVMGKNPSEHEGENRPVEYVSWYDAIFFCNKKSEADGLVPVYSVDGKTDTATWNYKPHKGAELKGDITQNTDANGYRLPTEEEWKYAAKGGEDYDFAGSDDLEEVGWYEGNSRYTTHEVAQKKANGYGLYDMCGNVSEWIWDADYAGLNRYYCGGDHGDGPSRSKIDYRACKNPATKMYNRGLRIVCSSK